MRECDISMTQKSQTMTHKTLYYTDFLKVFYISIGILTLNACAVGPSYESPQELTPQTPNINWNAQSRNLSYVAKHPINRWWFHLQDNTLNTLINNAIKGNLDLKIVRAEIDFFRAQKNIRQSALLPNLDTDLQAEKNHQFSETNDIFRTALGVSWELDLFGRLRHLKKSAINDLASSVETQRDIQILIISSVASSYIDIRALERRLAIANANVKSQEETIKIIKARLKYGIVNQLDLIRADADLKQVKARIPLFYSQLRSTKNRLSNLLGLAPGVLDKQLSQNKRGIPEPPQKLVVSMPNDLIRSRPDIRSAEYAIAAETSRLGASIAALYPSLSLQGNFGYLAPTINDLGTRFSEIATAGLTLRLPIFNAGRLRNNVNAQQSRQEQSIWRYEKTVLNALEETSNALTSFDENHKRVELLRYASEDAHKALRLAKFRYESGVSDLLDVLDTQRVQLAADDSYVQALQNKANAFVSLYKALGGGL